MSDLPPPPPPTGPPQPRVSDDGRFYWDHQAQRWLPMPARPLSSPQVSMPPQVVVSEQPRGAWNSCVGYGCMAIAALFVFVALAAWCGGNTTT